jgi:hypothetical protein
MTTGATEISFRRAAVLALALCSMVLAGLFATAAPALAETCPNEEFRTGASAVLPDCRAYELVTPPFKEGNKTAYGSSYGFSQMSASGLHIDMTSFGEFGDAKSAVMSNNYELSRTESGWTETNIDLPVSQFTESKPIDATPEMSAYLYEARATAQPLDAKDFWLREADGVLRDIGPFEPPADTEGPTGPSGGAVETVHDGAFFAASADLSHILFTSPVSWPGDEAYPAGSEYGVLYEYIVANGGPPVPVGVEPDGSPCAASYVAARSNEPGEITGISANGLTVFFVCSGKLFARIDNGEAGARTVAVSEGPAQFWTATPEGRYAFYTKGEELWRFDVQSGTREALAGAGAKVQDVVATSEDGEYAYFVADGVLAGRNVEGKEPVPNQPNLYLRHGGQTTFIAAISLAGPSYNGQGPSSATPDGKFLVFTSTADLTSGDTSTAQQIFEYDAQTSDLTRVSIGQDGFNDNGNTDVLGAGLPRERFYIHRQRERTLAVSDNGEYIVFQSPDGLTPGALNGVVEYKAESGYPYYIENVYEYHHGDVYLISDGLDDTTIENESSVEALGISPSGDDIFFRTDDQLAAQDVDTEVDLYDARINGGFPAPVSLLPTCFGDACQGPLTGAPVLLSPGSEFQAGGNPPLAEPEPSPAAKAKPKSKLAKCKKGYVKKNTRCDKAASKKKDKKSAKGRK